MTALEFYKANATNMVNVPDVGQGSVDNHGPQPGWAGVRRASEARFIAKDCLVMTLADACDFAEKYKESKLENYLIFTVVEHPRLFNVVEGKTERDRILEYHKSTYPSIPVYWQEVHAPSSSPHQEKKDDDSR